MLLLLRSGPATLTTDGTATALVAATGTAAIEVATSGSNGIDVAATSTEIVLVEWVTDGLASVDVATLAAAVSGDEVTAGVSIVTVSATEFAIVRYGMLATAGPVPRATLATF